MQATHLINTQLGIILLYAATQIPFSVFLISRSSRRCRGAR
jgi:raffinose/stachyose/melibiose transport system permease protein